MVCQIKHNKCSKWVQLVPLIQMIDTHVVDILFNLNLHCIPVNKIKTTYRNIIEYGELVSNGRDLSPTMKLFHINMSTFSTYAIILGHHKRSRNYQNQNFEGFTFEQPSTQFNLWIVYWDIFFKRNLQLL